jgi:hypothetical protein
MVSVARGALRWRGVRACGYIVVCGCVGLGMFLGDRWAGELCMYLYVFGCVV